MPSSHRKDLIGQKFGKLTVLSYSHTNSSKNAIWKVVCECGTEKLVRGRDLTRGHTKSCGCLPRDWAVTHGESIGGRDSVELQAYHQAKSRCRNSEKRAYKDYGGRGIEFRFQNFEEFLEELGRRPSKEYSLDRIDNNGHYEKGNVRWTTDVVQANNRSIKRIEKFSDEEIIREVVRRNLVVPQAVQSQLSQ